MPRHEVAVKVAAGAMVLANCGLFLTSGCVQNGGTAAIVLQAADTQDARGRIYRTAPPMNQTVRQRLMPELERLVEKLLAGSHNMVLDGVDVFRSDDKFLPGKVAVGMAYVLVNTPRSDSRFKRYLSGYRRIADVTIDDVNETWGIYYYAQALHMLQKEGLLEQAISPATLAKLRTRLDWRTFVRVDDLSLIDLPNNYIGVAFSVARLRYELGWEDASASEALLQRTLSHYRRYSGEYGFADETDGKGRFDRYSVLLIGEISHRLIETDMPASDEVRAWLRKSVDLMLLRLNLRGEGFEYGRSIGAYGETAFLEVLTAAAKLGVLSAEELEMAYAYSSRVSARYMDFWFDPEMGSVNLWEDGRRTDTYRGKHRILGENLSLARQHIYTNAVWNELGFKDKAPTPKFEAWLAKLPARTTTWFATGEYDRFLVTLRDRGRLISLPVINGDKGQHQFSPYYPIPFSPGMLASVADRSFPQLLPRVVLKDGVELAPLSFMQKAKVTADGGATIVSFEQTEVDRLGTDGPVPDRRLSIKTTYVFETGQIRRTDVLTPSEPMDIQDLRLSFAGFSGDPVTNGAATRFQSGDAKTFTVEGIGKCTSRKLDNEEDYRSPTGPMTSLVDCASGPMRLQAPLTITWTLIYG